MISFTGRIFEICQPWSVLAGEEQVPEPLFARQPLQVLQHLRRLVARRFRLHLLVIELLDRLDMRPHELADALLQLQRTVGVVEIHFALLFAEGDARPSRRPLRGLLRVRLSGIRAC
ncbi:hypothetical protein ACVWW4_002415 [Bradyrhizobium sp. LB7.1]